MAKTIKSLSHAEVGTQYARDVVSGKIVACKWVKLSCARHLSDLEAAQQKDFPYTYDHKKGSRPCRFIELLPHIEGKWAPNLIVLEPWQCFIICSLFGWVKKSDGFRRYKRAYCCIPRKNAKSTILAGLALYCLILDKERGAQVYVGATTKEQTKAVWKPARAMALERPQLLTDYGVTVSADSIVVPSTNSSLNRLIGNPGDGTSPHFVAIDEYHEHQDSSLYDTMVTGMGARAQPMAVVITTAGYDTGGPCYLLQKDMEKMLESITDNPTRFAIIYTVDIEDYTFNGVDYTADDWTTEDALIKANPNWGISVDKEEALIEQKEAVVSSEKQNVFKTKKLDIWCFARNGFFNVEKWNKLADPTLTMEQFAGQDCVKGLDLASEVDLASDVTVFQKMQTDQITKTNGEVITVEQMHYYIFGRHYVPESRVAVPTNQHYQKWVHDKHLIATPGDQIDFTTIKLNMLADEKEHTVKEFCCDPNQATLLSQEIQMETGIEMTPIKQNAPTLSIPMKWLQGLIASGRIHHDGNPVMTWCVSNVVAREDANENVFPRKEREENKIDGVAALLCALYRVRAALGEDTTEYYSYTGF